MENNQETHAEIIAMMHFHGQLNIDAEKDKPEYGILTVEGRTIQNFADHLAAAHEREIEDKESVIQTLAAELQAERAKNEQLRAASSARPLAGDTTKLREALEQAKTAIIAAQKKMAVENPIILEIIDAVLAAPPRNCDRFTTETDAQIAFLREAWLIGVSNLDRDPFDGWTKKMKSAYSKWLFAPATEKEGGAK